MISGLTRRPSNRPEPDLSASQRNEELVQSALGIIRQEIGRKPPQGGAPRALAMIREPAFKSKVAEAVEKVQDWKVTTKPEEWDRTRYGVLTAQQRKVAANIAAALRRFCVALRPLDSDTDAAFKLRLWTETGDFSIDFPMDRVELKKWQQHYQGIANEKVRAGSSYDGRKSVAVSQAAELLKAVGLPLAQTRNGAFEQLSAILWGKPAAHFLRYLKEFKKFERARARLLSETEIDSSARG